MSRHEFRSYGIDAPRCLNAARQRVTLQSVIDRIIKHFRTIRHLGFAILNQFFLSLKLPIFPGQTLFTSRRVRSASRPRMGAYLLALWLRRQCADIEAL